MQILKNNYFLAAVFSMLLLGACQPSQQISGNAQSGGVAANQNNMITASEKKQGWKLLFDGKTSTGWRGANRDDFPAKGWKVENEALVINPKGFEKGGGDIITLEQFDNFELTLEAKLTEGANSGLKYFVSTNNPSGKGGYLGLEFQILDDAKHPDAKMGENGNRTIGSLYDLIPADKNKKTVPIGEWNKVRVISKGNHVEHWLNGSKVLEFERGSPEFRALVAKSKYKANAGFGEAPKGPILLQDHNDEVHYRNIKIRKI